jgi:hypothetical protein
MAGGVAAAVALVVVAVRIERAERAGTAERAAASRATEFPRAVPEATAEPPDSRPAFRPIAFPRRLSSTESYSVVRVRLELATSAPGAGAAIEADLLVGEDGLARAIRFDSADTLPVYAAPGPANGERR